MIRSFQRPTPAALACACVLACTLGAHAERGKLLLTGGVSSIEGAAGGGLTPWAVTGRYATTGEIGGTAFVTGAKTQDYSLLTYGAALAFKDRVELSVARQDFDTKDNLAPLGLSGLHLKQHIFGLEVRVAGDAVLDSDTLMPQIAVGLRYKNANRERLATQPTEQLCEESGGPCKYEGAPMGPVHASMNIGKGDFNALVAVLQQSMDAKGIAFSAQNGMLARLAPMHRQIITRQ